MKIAEKMGGRWQRRNNKREKIERRESPTVCGIGVGDGLVRAEIGGGAEATA
jgi:hypothetical protein